MINPILHKITQTLRTGSHSAGELVARCHATDTAIRKHLRTLHDIGAIHIACYRRADPRNMEAVYAWGEGDDAPMPEVLARRVRPAAVELPKPVPLGAWGCVW
jgi:hypothetical protein